MVATCLLALSACTIDTSQIPVALRMQPDTGMADPDTGTPDAGPSDTGTPDTGSMDSGTDSGEPTCEPLDCFEDRDGDGDGNPAVAMQACECPATFVDNNLDCDDTCEACHQGGVEVCNLRNEDCDENVDEGVGVLRYPDADDDSHGSIGAELVEVCPDTPGYVESNDDCFDDDVNSYPDAPELCDEKDNDCDGVDDDNVVYVEWYVDADGDTYGDGNVASINDCAPVAGCVQRSGDCNDGNDAIRPGAVELCDDVDNDCDDAKDETLTRACGTCTEGVEVCTAGTWGVCSGVNPSMLFADDDGDGYGDPSSGELRCPASGYVANDDDCDDTCDVCFTGALELCDTEDNDCSATTADGSDDTRAGQACDVASDSDFCNDDVNTCTNGQWVCTDVGGSSVETCNNMDDDCDNVVDGQTRPCGDCVAGTETCVAGAWVSCTGVSRRPRYVDVDGDGRGSATTAASNQCPNAAGYADLPNDCNDNCAVCWTNATEQCDSLDNDCDNKIDENVTTTNWYLDADGDTYGNPAIAPIADCKQPANDRVNRALDCNDQNAAINPTGTESCDNVDQDCDNKTDEGLSRACGACTQGTETCSAGNYVGCTGTSQQMLYRDMDGDGRGAGSAMLVCAGAGFVANNNDCNDNCSACWTGRSELCDGFDNDCNAGTADGASEDWWNDPCDGSDADQCTDDIYTCSGGMQVCLDQGAARPEICDGMNNDCDAATDEGIAPRSCGTCTQGTEFCSGGSYTGCTGTFAQTLYRDADGDGRGTPSMTQQACPPQTGWSLTNNDCDDSCSTCWTGRAETCDGVNNDCVAGTADGASESWLNDECESTDADLCEDDQLRCVSGAQSCVDISNNRTETCNNQDDDCDGSIDDNVTRACGTCTPGTETCSAGVWGACSGVNQVTVYPDADGDGYGAANAAGTLGCASASGVSTNHTDCDDTCNACRPVAATDSTCDGRNQDCDGQVDENANLTTDANCGACGNSCTATSRICQNQVCVDPLVVRDIATSSYTSCAVRNNGQMLCWGDNYYGTLGTGNLTLAEAVVPQVVSASLLYDAVAGGRDHFCAIRRAATSGGSNSVECWGAYDQGRLGVSAAVQSCTGSGGLLGCRAAPTATGLSGVLDVCAGGVHSCAVMANGTVKCWGSRGAGQLGDGSASAFSATPVDVQLSTGGLLGGMSRVACGTAHSCAIGTSGVYCWGSNSARQAGGTTASAFLRATALSALSTRSFSRIALGDNFSCALQTNGDVWCWGENDDGELGRNTSGAAQSTPATINISVDVLELAAGAHHACVIVQAASSSEPILCWGRNDSGQASNPAGADVLQATLIGSNQPDALLLDAGGDHNCAVRSTTTPTVCWGNGIAGQLGNNTTLSNGVPQAVRCPLQNTTSPGTPCP